MSTLSSIWLRADSMTALENISEPMANKVMTTTNIAAKETQPFLQKFTNPAFVTLFIFVKIIILFLRFYFLDFRFYLCLVSSAFIISYYFAFFHSHHSSAERIHHFFIVRSQNNRRPQFIYFLKNTDYFLGAYGIKIARRLVRHHQVRPIYYRSGNSRFLALSAGKLVRKS